MKNKTFFDSIKCAVQGMRYALKSEKNFRIYIIIAVIFFVLNLICRTELAMHMIFLTICGGVFSAEFINTSLERLSDKVDGNFSSEIKIVKDVAAAGVLVWGIIFFILESVIIIGKFI